MHGRLAVGGVGTSNPFAQDVRHPSREAHGGAQGERDAWTGEGAGGDHHPVGAPGRRSAIDPSSATASCWENQLPVSIENISRPGSEFATGDLKGATLHRGPGPGSGTEGSTSASWVWIAVAEARHRIIPPRILWIRPQLDVEPLVRVTSDVWTSL